MNYYVIDKPCPECVEGVHTLKTVDSAGWPVILEVNCGRCFATGWIEEYRHGPGEGSSVAVEVPDRPDPDRAGSGRVPVPA